MADVESPMKSAPAARPRRASAFLVLGAFSLFWLLAMVWIVHIMHTPSHGKVEEATDFMGGDISSAYGVQTMLECRTRCEEHPHCVAFTYVKKELACWLKGPGGFKVKKADPNIISGSVNTTLAESRRKAFNMSADEAWEHRDARLSDDEGESYGDMHSRERGALEPDEGDDGRYGHGVDEDQLDRLPHETTEEERLKYNDSISYFGDVSVDLNVDTPADCEAVCLVEPTCVEWTFDKSRFICLRRLVNVSNVQENDMTIGAKLGPAQLAERAGRFADVDGGDPSTAQAKSVNGTVAANVATEVTQEAKALAARSAAEASAVASAAKTSARGESVAAVRQAPAVAKAVTNVTTANARGGMLKGRRAQKASREEHAKDDDDERDDDDDDDKGETEDGDGDDDEEEDDDDDDDEKGTASREKQKSRGVEGS